MPRLRTSRTPRNRPRPPAHCIGRAHGCARSASREPHGAIEGRHWNKVLYEGVLSHKLKEMCRIRISVAHQCGYCSTVRSSVAKSEGLTEDLVGGLLADFEHDDRFSEREKAALRYADAFKRGEHAIDRDDVYAELQRHFSDEEIIELGLLCAQTDGVGKFINP